MMNKISNINKNLYLNIIGSFSIKGLALVINFFTIPLYMSYFENANILGVWYTILSFLSWILMFDLGIGNGLRNHLVKPLLENDKITIKKLFSSAYIILGVISIILFFFGVVLIFSLNWNSIFNIPSTIIENKYLEFAFFISYIGIVLQFFLKTILSVLNAMEKTALSNGITLISSSINLIYLFLFKSGDDISRLFNLSIVYAISVNLPLIICTIALFLSKFKESIPSFKYFDISLAKKILNLGLSFFVIQILFMVITASNEFFISNIFGADKVVEFQIYNKVFYTFVTLFSLISNPIWSAVARASSENNMKLVSSLFRKLLLAVFAGIFGVMIIAFFFHALVNVWLGETAISINNNYIVAFVIYVCILLFVFSLNSIANGLQLLKPQMFCYSFSVIIKIFVLFVLDIRWDSWIIVIWINTLTLIPYVLWQLYDFKYLIFYRVKRRNR